MDKRHHLDRAVAGATLDYIDGQFYLWEGAQPEILSSAEPQQLRTPIVSRCLAGYKDYIIDNKPYRLSEGEFMMLHAGQFAQQTGVSEDFRAFTFAVTDRFVAEIPVPRGHTEWMLRQRINPVAAIDDDIACWAMMSFLNLSQMILRNVSQDNAGEALQHLLLSLSAVVRDRLEADDTAPETELNSRAERLVRDYLNLVQDKYRHTRQIEPYARQLGVSSKHLSNTVKELTNRSAGEWITLYVINEAKTLLRSTSMNVQEISDRLNFPSQSFFGKYFKRHTGLSPTAFRDQL